jgi:hypothetical protein
VKHTAGGQRLGRLACFATQKKTRNHIFCWRTQSPEFCGAEIGIAVHIQNTCQGVLLSFYYPLFIRPPSIESETATEILAGHWWTVESVQV